MAVCAALSTTPTAAERHENWPTLQRLTLDFDKRYSCLNGALGFASYT